MPPGYYHADINIVRIMVYISFPIGKWRKRPAAGAALSRWGKRYPYAGYGGRFRYWLRERNPKPYGSYGNGSAMRVSAVGWLYDSLERTREVARATANVTHNHPEGIKGAEATASAIYMATSNVYIHNKSPLLSIITHKYKQVHSKTQNLTKK